MNSLNNKERYRFPHLDRQDECELPSPQNSSHPDQIRCAAESAAYTEGFQKGKNDVLLVEQEKYRPLNELIDSACRQLDLHKLRLKTLAQNDVAKLSIAFAREILRDEIARNPEIVSQMVRRGLQLVKGAEIIRVKTNPKDIACIREKLIDIMPAGRSTEGVTLIEDNLIQCGGCLIETDFGFVDARIDQQLSAMGSALNEMLTTISSADAPGDANLINFDPLYNQVEKASTIKAYGHVSKVVGLVVEATGPAVQLGCICDIHGSESEIPVSAEVLGFRDRTVLMMPLEEIRTIGPGSRVVARQEKASVAVGAKLLGRVIDGLGNPIDGRGPLVTDGQYPIYASPINPLLRQRIRNPLDMGVRAINGLLTVGCGQRMGIFAGSGVGKSVLMGMIARKSSADVNVIALIGERGRELNEFIDKDLGPEGLKKTVVVVATSDHLPLVRVRGAFVATAVAEYFRDQGLQVNLMMDSLTRFAMAQREIGLALGEPPTTKGYTPSVFTLMPKLLERAGTSDHSGSITGLYTVLVEGDDMNEPIADAARSILDGHIVLSRELADHNHYPAIDILRSISRVMEDIATLQHKHNAGRLKELLATYRKAEDLINIGAYVAGANRGIDQAIAKIDQINGYLRQGIDENLGFEECIAQLDRIVNGA
jgi:flagellum-specific ATP synthase